MRREWELEDLIASWTLIELDWELIGSKQGSRCLVSMRCQSQWKPVAATIDHGTFDARTSFSAASLTRAYGRRTCCSPTIDTCRK
jgi:hypothetical protein